MDIRLGRVQFPGQGASRELIMAKIRRLPISYFSIEEQVLSGEAAQFLDPDLVASYYLSGWKERVDIDEIWFLSTHSSLLARLKKGRRISQYR